MNEIDQFLDRAGKMFAKSYFRIFHDKRLTNEQKENYLEKIGNYIIKANKIIELGKKK